MAIKPYISLGFDIFKDYRSISVNGALSGADYVYTTSDGTTTLGSKVVNYDGYNNGYMRPSVTVGAQIDLPPKESTEVTLGIEYGFGIGLYSNDYKGGVSGTADGYVSWTGTNVIAEDLDKTVTTQTSTLSVDKLSYMSHAITPSYLIKKDFNGVKLGFKAGLPIGMVFMSSDASQETRTKTVTEYNLPIHPQRDRTTTQTAYTYGGLEDVSAYTVAPELGIGASYQLIPNRFKVNAGVKVTPVRFTRTIRKSSPNGEDKTVTKTVDGLGNTIEDSVTNISTAAVTRTDTVQVSDAIDAFRGNVTGGFVFSFNDNFALDLLAGVYLNNNGSTSAGDDVWTTVDGTTDFNINVTTVKVLFTFKY